jgi:hypothetical protein
MRNLIAYHSEVGNSCIYNFRPYIGSAIELYIICHIER